MKSLIEKLSNLKTVPVEVPAPELGEGEVVHVKRMTLRERNDFNDLLRESRKEVEGGKYDATSRLCKLLCCVAINPDGTLAFPDGATDQHLGMLPGPLAERMIKHAVEAATLSESEAKK